MSLPFSKKTKKGAWSRALLCATISFTLAIIGAVLPSVATIPIGLAIAFFICSAAFMLAATLFAGHSLYLWQKEKYTLTEPTKPASTEVREVRNEVYYFPCAVIDYSNDKLEDEGWLLCQPLNFYCATQINLR